MGVPQTSTMVAERQVMAIRRPIICGIGNHRPDYISSDREDLKNANTKQYYDGKHPLVWTHG